MGVSTAVVRAAANTSNGTQEFTSSGFGTPKAALLILTAATADSSVAVPAIFGMGAADGTRQWGVYVRSDNNVSTSNVVNGVSSSACVYADDGSAITAVFSAWITDGVRINWTAAPGTAYLVTVVLFGGDDLSACAEFIDDQGKTVGPTYDNTAPGFQPDVMITAASVAEDISIGMVHNDGAGTVVQEFVGISERDARTTTQIGSWLSAQYGAGRSLFGGTLGFGVTFSDFDASGFSYTYVTDKREFFYLALSFGGAAGSYIGVMDTPTTTGNDSQVGPDFEPQLVLLGLSGSESVDSGYTDGRAGVFGVTAITPDASYSNAVALEDATGPSDTQSLSDDQAVNLPQHDGSAGHAASLVSMDATGYTLNYSATLGAAKKWLVLAIEAEATGGPTVSGQADITLADVGASAAGALGIEGAAVPALADATLSAAGQLDIVASLVQTLEAATLAATGTGANTGALAATLADVVAVAIGQVDLAADLAATLEAVALAAAGELDIDGDLAATLEAVAVAATGDLALRAALAQTLEAATATAAGTGANTGSLATTLADVVAVASGQLDIAAALAQVLEAVGLAAVGDLAGGSGALAVTLDDVGATGAGALAITGATVTTLEGMTLTGVGVAAVIAVVYGTVMGPGAMGVVSGPRASGSIGG